jgi:hypothetical protein
VIQGKDAKLWHVIATSVLVVALALAASARAAQSPEPSRWIGHAARAHRGPRAATEPQVGFFCTGPAALTCLVPPHQLVVRGYVPECPNEYGQPQVEGVYRDDQLIAAYVDDSLGAAEAGTQACAQTYLPTFAGSASHQSTLANSLVEFYPVLDHRSRVGRVPSPGSAGYILQAFSWGDNIWDGTHAGRCTSTDDPAACSSRYQAPSGRQLHAEWCGALRHHPRVILWYYAGSESTAVLRAEHKPC